MGHQVHPAEIMVVARKRTDTGKHLQRVDIEYQGPSGARGVGEVVDRANGVRDIAVAWALTDQAMVICIEQLRPAIVPPEQYGCPGQRRALGLVAGLCDTHRDPLAAAKAELREEAGYVAERWIALPPSAECEGFSSGIVHTFLALRARRVGEPMLEPAERALGLRTIKLPLGNLAAALLRYAEKTGNVVDPKILACKAWYEHVTGKGA